MSRRPAPFWTVRGALALLLILPSSGLAHDIWILPGKYRLQVDEVMRVFVNNGDVFPESLTLVGEHRLREVSSLTSAGELPISEFRVDGKSLTFDFRSAAAGAQVIALETKPRTVRMNAEDFEAYLAEEGLTKIADVRKERGESAKAAVERYIKFAKAVIEVGEGSSAARPWADGVGQIFEIVPLDDPNQVRSGEPLRLRVLLHSEPLAGVPIRGARASAEEEEIAATTDERGECAVTATTPGRWYVRALHMVHLDDHPEVSWESYWATLTFEVQSASGGEK
ncbi:MAG TPA: DUF4198 domain-containing protein [Vicinamibacteria bacterium]|nr:DUF4198 domain-containing protein [Vicinamibacteria bacterium]